MQEDKWEPIRIATDDPQVQLLNKLGERKRKELKEKEKMKVNYLVIFRLYFMYEANDTWRLVFRMLRLKHHHPWIIVLLMNLCHLSMEKMKVIP